MDIANAAWLAGIIEGEGFLSLTSNGRGLRVVVRMTDEDVIARAHAVGGGKMTGPDLREGRKPIWTWAVHNREDVLELFDTIEPHMGARRSARIAELRLWAEVNPKGRPRKDAAQHGSISKYTNDKCRCDLCRQAEKDYRASRRNKA